MRHFHSENHISKIFVQSYNCAPFRSCFFEYALIIPATTILKSRDCVEIVLSKPPHHGRAYALINQETHLNCLGLDRDERGVLKSSGGEEKTGIDIALNQAWILRQDLLYGGAMCQEPQDVLNREPSAFDNGFANHYPGIYGDPI